MNEILPGLHHWSAMRETIHKVVHSVYVEEARTLIDPMLPADGMTVFERDLPAPERIVLTNRLHRRHSERFVEAFGCSVAAPESGLPDLAGAPFGVSGYQPGEEVAPGIVAHEVGVLCPDESALLIAIGSGVLAVADGVIAGDDGRLAFVPDALLGDDPAAIKRGLGAAYSRLCEQLEFDVLLLAHGPPQVGEAKRTLYDFAREAAVAR